ncbi:helix-turn-helix domain-containing protein [Amedibacillus sp. YH-ame6]
MSDVNFGKLFNELCDSSGKTNADIARGLGVDKATVGRWRSGERMPKLSALPDIADYFNVDIHMFSKSKSSENPSYTFDNAQDAALFILKNPVMMNYGGYSIDRMSDEELLETAQQIADYMAFVVHQKLKDK